MRKLTVRCECGQLMQVPRSAVGKLGLCPSCGQTVRITSRKGAKPGAAKPPRRGWNRTSWWRGQAEPSESAKQRFGQAVDLYNESRYAEALAVFDALAKEYPGNPDVEHGQAQCMRAMRRPSLPPASTPKVATELTVDSVKQLVLEKMTKGSSETVQLQAAELAARMLGILDGGLSENGKQPESTPEEASAPEPSEARDIADDDEAATGSDGGDTVDATIDVEAS